jgi:hypothetical protein
MRLRNTPVLAAAADGKWVGRRHIRERMHGFSTCPMLYEFARAHHIGRSIVGGVNHPCTCCGAPDPPELSKRETAREAVRY